MDYNSYGAFYQNNRLLNEVLYLHGLWNQGPHGSSPAESNTFNPNPRINHLRPRSSVKFRKDRNHRIQKRKKAAVSEKEWPIDSSSNPSIVAAVGWPDPPPKRAPRPLTADDIASTLAARAQRNAMEACKIFFSKKNNDGDAEEGDDVCDVEEEDGEEEEVEDGAFRFFVGIFTKDSELRGYYEANYEKGEFSCLVCEGSGVKKGRTFSDCVGLIQHCINVAKIGRRAAHRGLAKSVCRVVGWNFDRLPMFILDLQETLGQALANVASPPQEKAEEIMNEVAD